jgi:hypothetical protein
VHRGVHGDGRDLLGERAHAEGEHVIVEKMPERAALLAALVRELIGVNK